MTIKRLSYKKIQIEYTVAIFCGESKIGDTVMKFRYKLVDNTRPQMLPIRDAFYNQLSNKFSLKKKFISIKTKTTKVIFEGKEIFIRCPDYISFNNTDWLIAYNRNRILSEMLK